MEQNSTANQQKRYLSPAGNPYLFNIGVNVINGITLLEVQLAGAGINTPQSQHYELNPAMHNSYLDLFENLHTDISLRMPQNRKPARAAAFDVNYTEVLSTNLDPGMKYGYGDPAIIRVDEDGKTVYYVVSTSNDAPDSFPIVRSENLIEWTFVGYVFPQGSKPVWAADGEMVSDYWAPEMHKVGNEYRVYFVARDKDTRELCIGLARSLNPAGPFTADQQPVLKGNIIDPHIFVKNDNTVYLLWKQDNNDVWPGALLDLLYHETELIRQIFSTPEDLLTASFMVTLWPWLQTLAPMERFLFTQTFIEAVIDRYLEVYTLLMQLAEKYGQYAGAIGLVTKYMKTPMFAQQLTADGDSFTGEPTKILENDLEWEAHLVEGMWLTKQGEKYYLFYAGNDFSTDQYGIGVAVADTPLGPFHKVESPILKSNHEWLAPGHPSVTTGLDGKPVMFLHAFFPGKAGYKQFRALLSVNLRFEGNHVYVA